MTVVAVFGAKHSPGATTVAVALAAVSPLDDEPLVIEADPAGGDLAARTGLGIDPGLLSLAAAGRRGLSSTLVDAHTQRIGNGARVLVAPPSPEHARAALESLVGPIAGVLRNRPGLTVVDAGRWDCHHRSDELLSTANVIVAVFRPTVEGVEHVKARVRCLPAGANVVMLMVGERPYPMSEVRVALDPCVIHVVEHDPRTASVVGNGRPIDFWMRRTGLMRDVTALHAIVTTTNTAPVASL